MSETTAAAAAAVQETVVDATPAAAAATEEKVSATPAAQGETKDEESAADAVEEVTQSLEEILALGQGLDDEDYKAELEVLQNDPNSNLYSAVTFEELNLCVRPLSLFCYDLSRCVCALCARSPCTASSTCVRLYGA